MKLKLTLSIVLFSLIFATNNYAQEKINRNEHFNLNRGIALQGFDPVTFFTQTEAVRANGSISYTYNGVKYFFSSTKNLTQFKNTPSKFEPQYGGWCAYHMSVDGNKIAASAEFFTIKNGKLYFFNSKESQQNWLIEEELKEQADQNWSAIFR